MGKVASPSGTVRVLLIDDHPIVRRGVHDLLDEQDGIVVCGEADNPRDALEAIRNLDPSVAIVDLSLGDDSGLELIKQIKTWNPSVGILVFSIHDERLFVERVLQAGALGFVNKAAPSADLISAVRRVARGEVYTSPEAADRLLRRVIDHKGDMTGSPLEQLSDRELEVFRLVGRGMTTRQIAKQLYVSPKTVESYREHIKAKLNLSNFVELLQRAVQWDLEQHGKF